MYAFVEITHQCMFYKTPFQIGKWTGTYHITYHFLSNKTAIHWKTLFFFNLLMTHQSDGLTGPFYVCLC